MVLRLNVYAHKGITCVDAHDVRVLLTVACTTFIPIGAPPAYVFLGRMHLHVQPTSLYIHTVQTPQLLSIYIFFSGSFALD